jgi:hypothetical protein
MVIGDVLLSHSWERRISSSHQFQSPQTEQKLSLKTFSADRSRVTDRPATWHITCVYSWQHTTLMKTKALLFLAALGLFVSTRSIAAQPKVEADVVVLPTYVVRVPRYQPFETQMQKDLNEVRQQASTPMTATLTLLPTTVQIHGHKLALNLPSTKATPAPNHNFRG